MANRNLMLDLETLGTEPGCKLVSIGACFFDSPEQIDQQIFYQIVNFSDQYILTSDPKTIAWHEEQNSKSENLFSTFLKHKNDDGMTLKEALYHFALFIEQYADPETVCLWGNGASFDAPILKRAYNVLEMKVPWNYRNEKCFRTLRNMFPNFTTTSPRIPHHALSDAQAQAEDAYHLLTLFEIGQNFLSRSPSALVRKFHNAFGHPVRNCIPFEFQTEDLTRRLQWAREELEEIEEAIEKRDWVGVADGIADAKYFLTGMEVANGIPGDEVFLEVHKSNMSKLENGLPAKDPLTGRVIKGKDYSPPDVVEVLRRYAGYRREGY